MFDVILDGYHRFVTMLFRWLPVPIAPLPGYRVARLLLTMLPDVLEPLETIRITQKEIASRLKVSRATVAQDIAFLYDRKVVQTGHGQLMIDTKRLIDYLGGH
jgi:hypothetical protein